MKIHQEKVWAGTESSLKAALEAEESAAHQITAGNYPTQEDDQDEPRLLEVADGVATISIKGSLNNESGIWNEIFGMTGYPEIRDALVSAATNQDVKQILLDIDSGGGAVSGVADTANLIRMINDNVKPVSTFTDGTMASAAYWLGCAAGDVYAGRTAVVGSIGVLSTHKEYSQALKEAGVGVTVVRAGKYKALANSVEPLSEAGKQQIQQVVDAAYQVFVEHVASMRGKSFDYADQTMAQGQEFVGVAAADVGLIDGISTFDDVVGQLKAKSIDASNNFMDTRGKPKMGHMATGGTSLTGESDMKKALTEQDIAAIAAGSVALSAEADKAEQAKAAAAEAAAQAEADEKAAQADQAAEEQAAEEQAATQNVDTSAAAVQFLNAQVKEANDNLIQAHVEIARLKDELTKAQATHAPLLDIAAKSVNNMRVALGGSAMSAEGLDAVQVLAEHKNLSAQFADKFKVGGVAAVSASEQSKAAQIDPLHKARINAARFNRK